MNKTVFDKVEFIIHKIIVGIAFWIISSVVITYQQYIIKQTGNTLLNLFLYLVPTLALVWFISVSRKKNQWKPLGSNSDIIGIIIIILVSAILLFNIGILKVII
jgi:hypothetical protein